ncbi:MAG: serine hydrolase [Saprospiraceae bacterium]|nr:serine hydrolase [Saprospiraceae bacterium]
MRPVFNTIHLFTNRFCICFSKIFGCTTTTFLFFLLVSFNSSSAQRTNEVDALFEHYKTRDTPGIAVSVIKDGKVIYEKGFGMANLEYEIPIKKNTKFHVASLAKQFTAFMILKLEDEGLLSIDDDVRTYIPELPDYGHTITLRHLLTHSSGLRGQWRLLEMAGWRLDDVIKTEQIFKLLKNQKELNFTPGDRFMYCNSGFTLLAIVVERLTGTSFANYAKQTIFDPLQMGDSFFYDDHEEIMRNRAYSYKKVDQQLKKSNLNFATVGPTSLFTTVEDMSKWAINFKKMTVGNKAIFQSMNQKAKKNDGSVVSYAKGQFVREYKGHKMIYHSGSDAGYRSYFARFPDLGYQFILFANASYINAYDEIFKVIDYYLEDTSPENKSATPPNEEFVYDEDIFIHLTTAELKKFEGVYYDREAKHYREIEIENDSLFYKREDGTGTKLHPVGKSNFKMVGTAYDISINFKKNDFEEPILEFRIPDIMWLWLIKVKKVNISDYLGIYYNDELGAQYELVEKDEELFLTHLKLDDIKVTQINDAYFCSDNRNFSNIRFKRNTSGEIVEFSVSNDGVKNITFLRR